MAERADGGLTVFIVDDDPGIRDSLALLLSLRGHRTALFATAEDFLGAIEPSWNGCVLADLRMPGASGLELMAELRQRGLRLPVVIITAHGDVAAARAAFKSEAVDFLEKPFDDAALLAALESAFDRERSRVLEGERERREAKALRTLTERERSVARLAVQGLHNRDIGEQLGISPRTVEIHKARVMAKLGARNLADLIRLTGTHTHSA